MHVSWKAVAGTPKHKPSGHPFASSLAVRYDEHPCCRAMHTSGGGAVETHELKPGVLWKF